MNGLRVKDAQPPGADRCYRWSALGARLLNDEGHTLGHDHGSCSDAVLLHLASNLVLRWNLDVRNLGFLHGLGGKAEDIGCVRAEIEFSHGLS